MKTEGQDDVGLVDRHGILENMNMIHSLHIKLKTIIKL